MELFVPEMYRNIVDNYGFEALAYDTIRQVFYTTTENVLTTDGSPSTPYYPVQGKLRIQSFSSDLKPLKQYIYMLDAPLSKTLGRSIVHGVTAMTALPDGRLVVLEREANITKTYNKSKVWNKLYLVDLNEFDKQMTVSWDEPVLKKTLLSQWQTCFKLGDSSFANYEGMCLGRPTADGRMTLILLSDSQGGYGFGPVHLSDYIRVIAF